MHLVYRDLTIRSATSADAAQLAAWWNDGAVMAHAGFPKGLGTTPEKVAAGLLTDSDTTRRRLIIEKGGSPIGEMSYTISGDAAEIGIKICETSHQDHGQGKLLLSMLIVSLFDDLHCARIILDTNLRNLRAQHVYEQLGFRKLRVNVDAWTDQLGEKQSSVDYELLPEDFRSYLDSDSRKIQ